MFRSFQYKLNLLSDFEFKVVEIIRTKNVKYFCVSSWSMIPLSNTEV